MKIGHEYGVFMADKDNMTSPGMWPLVLLLAAVFFTWLFSGYYVKDFPQRGTFGDMFGAVNALFSGLAFAGVIYAIFLQRKELELQRRELESTREELEGQKIAMIEQNKFLNKQSLEGTFFQMLEFHNYILGSIEIRNSQGEPVKGKDCFRLWHNEIIENFEHGPKENRLNNEVIQYFYNAFYQEWQGSIGHYFRSLYNIVKFVHYSDLADKKFYTNLVRAQLSVYELLLIFYNCEYGMGKDKFKLLIEDYSLLKTLSKDQLIHPDHYCFYDTKAYQ